MLSLRDEFPGGPGTNEIVQVPVATTGVALAAVSPDEAWTATTVVNDTTRLRMATPFVRARRATYAYERNRRHAPRLDPACIWYTQALKHYAAAADRDPGRA
jgi:hypothetical protein